VWVTFLAIFANNTTVIVLILTKESLRVVVTVDVDLSEGIMSRWLNTSLVDSRLKPRKQQLQSGITPIIDYMYILNHTNVF